MLQTRLLAASLGVLVLTSVAGCRQGLISEVENERAARSTAGRQLQPSETFSNPSLDGETRDTAAAPAPEVTGESRGGFLGTGH